MTSGFPVTDISVVGGGKIRYWNLRKNGWKYELESAASFMVPVYPPATIGYPLDDPFVTLSPEGLLWFRADYKWDGPSGPTVDTPYTMRAALVHDGLYQLMRAGLLAGTWRERADELLRDYIIEDVRSTAKALRTQGWLGRMKSVPVEWLGMRRAEAWYRAVRMFSGPAAAPGHDVTTDIEEAP